MLHHFLHTSLVAAVAMLAQTGTTATPHHTTCAALSERQGLNLPATSQSDATEIVHGAAVAFDGVFAGALYVTRSKNVYLQVGKISPYPQASASEHEASVKLADALGVVDFQVGSTIAVVDDARLPRILGANFSLTSCF